MNFPGIVSRLSPQPPPEKGEKGIPKDVVAVNCQDLAWNEKKDINCQPGLGPPEEEFSRQRDSRIRLKKDSHGGCQVNGPKVAKFLDR